LGDRRLSPYLDRASSREASDSPCYKRQHQNITGQENSQTLVHELGFW
jgi:hypothetical protein